MAGEALFIIDMLNDFVRKGAPLEVPQTRKAMPGIRREIERARKHGNPVIYICDTHAPDDVEFSRYGWPAHGVRGTKGAEVVDELKPERGDIVVHKTTYSGFYKTNLDRVLSKHRIDSVRLTGCVTHICILFTAYEAGFRNLNVSVVLDGIAGTNKKDHNAALRIMKNVLGTALV